MANNKSFPVRREGDTCPDCGGTFVKNPKTNKVFCQNKCWLNAKPTPQQKAQVPPFKSQAEVDKKWANIRQEKADHIKLGMAFNKAIDCYIADKITEDGISSQIDRFLQILNGK